jgi:Tfp pilus assembly protein PilO
LNLKNRQQLLAILAGAAIGLYAADKLLLAPLTNSWNARAKRIEELRKNVKEGRTLLSWETELRGSWDRLRTNTLPRDRSLAEQQMLKAFDRWAQDSRVNITSITPQWKQEADDYTTLECRVEAAGDLSTVSRFLYDVEQDPMALKMQVIEINARDADGQQLSLGLQVSGLVLSEVTP